MAKANVTIIEAQMGEGKTTTATAIAVDAYKARKAKIFTNYHLYGIPYVYCTIQMMIKMLNTGIIKDGILIIDEAYIEGEARRAMSSLTLLMTWFGQQMRKRNIELYIIVQHGRFIDWRFRYIMKRKITCTYNEKSHMVRLLIQDLKKGTEKIISYWSPQYWPYYNTNEIPTIPQDMIDKALKISK